MKIRTIFAFSLALWQLVLCAQTRYWQVQDGLPTGEVRQIIPLPNHQTLVNCEGVFCISDGESFLPLSCDRRQTYQLEHYADSIGYGHYWQGDSLLWLRDFYRVYLFDMSTRSFRYDISERLISLSDFTPSPSTVNDWQGGTWSGTLGNGIAYIPPMKSGWNIKYNVDSLIAVARKAAELNLQFRDGRCLKSRNLNQLICVNSADGTETLLNERLPQLYAYRYIVGACSLSEPWIVLYSQNGACMLNTETDTLAPFPPSDVIDEYTDKYNCMVQGTDSTLWIGTQNGLFKYDGTTTLRIEGLANNCIRSLVLDTYGNVWAGTAYGISKITPSVANLDASDGIPLVSMMERAACLTADGSLVFVHHSSHATIFRPEWLSDSLNATVPVLTQFIVNGNEELFNSDNVWSLAYDENYLTFHFSSLDYAHPSHVLYRYRLVGLEDEWNQSASSSGSAVADYKALPPGDYLFEAQASSDDGTWSESLTVSVTIHPPFWLTWWAKLIYCGIVLLIGIILLRLYIRKKRRQLERENDAKVNRLFELREEARHQFAENTQIDPKKIAINAEEEKLMLHLLAAVEEHLDDTDYNVDQLARDVALSRTNLYNKLRNMLGISPADFIRNVRLKRAAQLLSTSTASVSEISERVGFATPRNFSVSFKKMFGVLPSEYKTPGNDNNPK